MRQRIAGWPPAEPAFVGTLLMQREPGALTLQLGALTRVRSNPFWPLIEADVAATVDADLAAAAR
jgi:hypothetical protein